MRRALVLLALLASVGAQQGSRAGPDYQLPNLVPLLIPPIYIGFQNGHPETKALRFTLQVANRGDYPFDVHGLAEQDDLQRAYQCVRWAVRACLERKPAGSFAWVDPYVYFAVLGNFARYQLRTLGPDGNPADILVDEEVDSCVEDLVQDSTWQPGAQDLPLYEHCDPVLQGISPGWAAQYVHDSVGQGIPLSGVDDGTYALVVVINPDRQFLETDIGDDMTYRVITISGHGTKVTVPE